MNDVGLNSPRDLAAIADLVGGALRGNPALVIRGAADLGHAGPEDIAFVQARRYEPAARVSRAAAFLCPPGLEVDGRPVIEVVNPKYAFVRLLQAFHPDAVAAPGIHPSAVVAADARLGEGVHVGALAVVEAGARIGSGTVIEAGAVIGAGCEVGRECRIHANAALYPGCRIGDRCILLGGCVVGADGYGFIQESRTGMQDDVSGLERYRQMPGPHVKVPHLGTVEIGDDVEIGASTTIDRGTVGNTFIGTGTKIDNQVQIGHNCRLGRHVLISGNAGLAGSVTLGDHVTVCAKAAIYEGARVGDFAIIGANSVVYPSKRIPEGAVVAGNPARRQDRAQALLKANARLPELIERVRELEQRLVALEKDRR